jgi:succinoglycan biosynthesis protein ExoU
MKVQAAVPQDRVAVIIPARNAEATIARAVASALAEPEAAQVVVVDDGSTDETAARALACDDGSGRLTVHRLATSGGPAQARNLAIALTDAPWIAPLDADDFLLAGRLARLLDYADDVDLVADDLLLVPEGAEDGPPKRLIGDALALPARLDFCGFVDGNISRPRRARREYGFLKPLIRRDFLERHGLAYQDLRLGEDFVLYATALANGARFRLAPACGYVAVQRQGSLSHCHSADDLRRLLAACEQLGRQVRLKPRECVVARRHQRHLQAKIDLRDVLDMRRKGGFRAAARLMLRRAHNAPYILRQKVADGVKRRAAKLRAKEIALPKLCNRSAVKVLSPRLF